MQLEDEHSCPMNRREFLKRGLAVVGGLSMASFPCGLSSSPAESAVGAMSSLGLPFRISLAEWSLHNTLEAKKLDNLDFPRVAKADYGIDTVEYVDQFFADKARDTKYLAELRKRCEGEGVRSGLIMIDTAGRLGAADAAERDKAVENHKAWLDAAKFLGCHAMRINAHGDGSADELKKRIVESCSRLAEYASKLDLNLIIENHGGLSSDPAWLTSIMREVSSPWFGTLPDFGNFPPTADRYDAIEKLMPFAKAVSAKSVRFDADGNVADTDYPRMMRIVLDAGYRWFVGVESEVESVEEEPRAIKLTKASLERFRAAQPVLKPIFNGKDLEGWAKVEGGDWTVENGVLVGRNGKGWSTDPSRSGSWLRSAKEYSDFELVLEYSVKPGTNSGVFFRSALERNPAFTGYEVQILDAPGKPPSKSGPGALYDVIAPSKNRVRPAGEWNEVRVIARGPTLRVHMNGEMVIDTRGERAHKGYVGLQNHDERSEVRFRSILLAELA